MMAQTGQVGDASYTLPNAPPEEDPAPPYSTYDRRPSRVSQPVPYNQPNRQPSIYSYPNSSGYPGPPPPLPQGYYPISQPGFVNPSTSTSTTVVIGQPLPVLGHPNGRTWSSSVCDCCDDMTTCCCGTFCYPCLACQVSTDMGESFCVPCCVPGWLMILRTKMRVEQNIAGSVLDDCCTVCFCSACALCQLDREIKICRSNGQMRIN